MLQITRKTTLKFNDDNANSITLSPGYYFFPGIKGDFDILSKAFLGKIGLIQIHITKQKKN